MAGFTTALLVGGALAGGVIGGSLARSRRPRTDADAVQPATPATPDVPAPPPTASAQASAAQAQAGVVAQRTRRRASAKTFAALARGSASGLAQPSGSPKGLIGG
jgi:hypothetical protein